MSDAFIRELRDFLEGFPGINLNVTTTNLSEEEIEARDREMNQSRQVRRQNERLSKKGRKE